MTVLSNMIKETLLDKGFAMQWLQIDRWLKLR